MKALLLTDRQASQLRKHMLKGFNFLNIEEKLFVATIRKILDNAPPVQFDKKGNGQITLVCNLKDDK